MSLDEGVEQLVAQLMAGEKTEEAALDFYRAIGRRLAEAATLEAAWSASGLEVLRSKRAAMLAPLLECATEAAAAFDARVLELVRSSSGQGGLA